MKKILFLHCFYILLSNLLFSQGAEDVSFYISKECENCVGKKVLYNPLVDGISQKRKKKYIKLDDISYRFIHYNNEKGTPENPLSKEGFQLVFHDEFLVNSTLDTLHTPYNPPSYPVIKRGENYPKWMCSKNNGSVGNMDCSIADVQHTFIQADSGIDGKLILQTLKSAGTGGCEDNYLINNLAANFRLRYGYLEARIKVPKGRGLVPAFVWWAPGYQYQEIDLFEFFQGGSAKYMGRDYTLGHSPKRGKTWKFHSGIYYDPDQNPENQPPRKEFISRGVHFTPHNGKAGNINGYYKQLDLAKDFFIYAVEWTPDSVFFYLNNIMYWKSAHKMTIQPMQFSMAPNLNGEKKGFQALFNDGRPNKFTDTLTQMEIDYIRVYKKDTQAEFNRILEGFPSQICNNENYYSAFAPTDNFPDTKYHFELQTTDGVIIPEIIDSIRIYDFSLINDQNINAWAVNGQVYMPSYGTNYRNFIYKELPAGNYKLHLRLSFPDSSSRDCYKSFVVTKIAAEIILNETLINESDDNTIFATAKVTCGTAPYTFSWYRSRDNLNWIFVKKGENIDFPAYTSVSGTSTTYIKLEIFDNLGNKITEKTQFLHHEKPHIPEETNDFAPENSFKVIPNPNNGYMEVIINLTQNDFVQAEIYNLFGMKMTTICNTLLTKGENVFAIGEGINFVSGVYLVRVTGTHFQLAQKIVVIK